MVGAGHQMTGDKRFLGVETDTENEQVLTPFLRSLVERGSMFPRGFWCVGGKGLRAAVRHAFRHPPWCSMAQARERGELPGQA